MPLPVPFSLFPADDPSLMMLAIADKRSAGNASSSRVCSTGEPSMLSNLSQYSPQGLLPQFPGLQTAGLPQMTPGLFGQPGAYNGNAQFGNAQLGPESGQGGFSQPFAFGGQANPFMQNAFPQNPFVQNPFAAGAFAPNPYLQGQWQSPVAHNPFLSSFAGQAGAHIPAQQIVPVLGQLAQQIAFQ